METDPRSEPWLLSNYIQLRYDIAPRARVPMAFYVHDYTASPWLDTLRLTQDWLGLSGQGFVDFARDQVARNYYLHLSLDEYFIPNRPFSQTRHYTHDVLICGFDDSDRTFKLIGYDADRRYSRTEAPYDSVADAWESHIGMDNDNPDVILHRLKSDASYPLDLNLIERTIEEYATGQDTSVHFAAEEPPRRLVYGIDTYDRIIDNLLQAREGERPIDPRSLHVLWEHKRLMVRRVAATVSGSDGDSVLDIAVGLEAATRACRSGLVMAFLLKRVTSLDRIMDELSELKKLDTQFVAHYLGVLRSSGPCTS
ncbi:hypothetical protein [Nocardioides sp. SYSU D00038]|uniref:hypothetical protein n=1 Tax=Nocardioides sp. SYSU D00038 TaxID=2812554 RepID=UPI0019680A95|nr:hypothetical protein [Nocardioides sp. SYSU D00038]